MTDKPDLKLIEAAASDDPYDLARLRITPEMLETTTVKKLLTTVPMRKPIDQDFVRVHPSPQYRETLAFVELKEDREIYIADLAMVPELRASASLPPCSPRSPGPACCSCGRSRCRRPTARPTNGMCRRPPRRSTQ